MSKKDIKDISDLIRKKLELYMNVERRENRFDPRGRFTTTPKMHKYDFLYKVLDSTVLETKHKKSRYGDRRDENRRPKTSVKSPERSKTARKSSERAKSSLVRSSVSPKRERRSSRRVVSPGPLDSSKRRNKEQRSTSRDDAQKQKAGRSFPRSNAKMDESQMSQSTEASARASHNDSSVSPARKPLISPRLSDTTRRVVLHREYDRLTNYANDIFQDIPLHEVQVIHRYRPSNHDDQTRYQGFSRHVGSILRSKEFVDYYKKEGGRRCMSVLEQPNFSY